MRLVLAASAPSLTGRVVGFGGLGVQLLDGSISYSRGSMLLQQGFDVVKVDCEGCEWTLEGRHISMAPVWLIEVTGSLERFLLRVPSEYKVEVVSRGLDSDSLRPTYLVLVYNRRLSHTESKGYRWGSMWIQGLQRSSLRRALGS